MQNSSSPPHSQAGAAPPPGLGPTIAIHPSASGASLPAQPQSQSPTINPAVASALLTRETPSAKPGMCKMVATYFFVAVLVAAVAVAPVATYLWFQVRAPAMNAGMVIASYVPTAEVMRTGYLDVEVKWMGVDVVAGQSQVIVTKVRPFGQYAAGPGSTFLQQGIELFINGNRKSLSADTPPGPMSVPIVHQDGNPNYYPYDQHTARLGMYAMTTTDLAATVAALAANTTLGRNPFVPLKWTITAAGPATAFAVSSTNDDSAPMAALGIADVPVTMARTVTTKAVATGIMVGMWLIALCATAAAVAHVSAGTGVDGKIGGVVESESTAGSAMAAFAVLLLALPALRAAQPQVPPVGTLADTTGYFWHLFLTSFSFVLVGLHSLAVRRRAPSTPTPSTLHPTSSARDRVEASLVDRHSRGLAAAHQYDGATLGRSVGKLQDVAATVPLPQSSIGPQHTEIMRSPPPLTVRASAIMEDMLEAEEGGMRAPPNTAQSGATTYLSPTAVVSPLDSAGIEEAAGMQAQHQQMRG
ncbi:hypothetical protein GGF32_002730 [Allomyces javanicus]|nr:hypothetical protein GGF32_002730 [Allomyces javanicus]